MCAQEWHRGISTVYECRHAAVQRAIETARIDVEIVESALRHVGARRELHHLGNLTEGSHTSDLFFGDDAYRGWRVYDALPLQRSRGHGQGLDVADYPADRLFNGRRHASRYLDARLRVGVFS